MRRGSVYLPYAGPKRSGAKDFSPLHIRCECVRTTGPRKMASHAGAALIHTGLEVLTTLGRVPGERSCACASRAIAESRSWCWVPGLGQVGIGLAPGRDVWGHTLLSGSILPQNRVVNSPDARPRGISEAIRPDQDERHRGITISRTGQSSIRGAKLYEVRR